MRLMKKNVFSQNDIISSEPSTKSTSNILKLKKKSYFKKYIFKFTIIET